MWEIIPLFTTLSTHKYTFFTIFVKFYYRTVTKKELIPAYKSAYENIVLLAKLIIFFTPPGRFSQGLLNFASVNPNQKGNLGDNIEALIEKDLYNKSG